MGEKGLFVAALVLGAVGVARADSTPVAYGDGGLEVGSAKVFDRKVDGAALDAAQDLLWFVSGGQLEVIDLREAAPRPVVIAKNMPPGPFAISGWSNASFDARAEHSHPRLVIGKKSKIAVAPPNWSPPEAGPGDGPSKKAVKKVKIVGAKWLRGLDGRKPNGAPTVTEQVESQLAQWCAGHDNPPNCGHGRAIGATGYVIAQTSHDDGFAHCVLWNTRSADMGSLIDGKNEIACENTAPDPAGDQYYANDFLCTPGTPAKCTENAGWTYIGWTAVPTPTAAAWDTDATDSLQKLEKVACECRSAGCKKKLTDALARWDQTYPDALRSGAQAQETSTLHTQIENCLK